MSKVLCIVPCKNCLAFWTASGLKSMLKRAGYHAAMEMPSISAMLLTRTSVKMLQDMNVEQGKALNVTVPLMHVAANITETFGTSKALSGQVDRADTETMKKHIGGIRSVSPCCGLCDRIYPSPLRKSLTTRRKPMN